MKNIQSMIGRTFNSLIVLDYDPDSVKKVPNYICRCVCGKVRSVNGSELRRGRVKSCGCQKNHPIKDMSGKVCGKWVVLNKYESQGKKRGVYWLCRCVCGSEHIVNGRSLRSGSSKSCGCSSHTERTLPKGESAFNALFWLYKNNAKNRSIVFDLTKDQFRVLLQQNCFYCGIEPLQSYKAHVRGNGAYVYNGIDRKDNSKGYSIDNAVSCCKTCNLAKSDLSMDIFIEWIARVYNNSCR
jgi:hypothetical protein